MNELVRARSILFRLQYTVTAKKASYYTTRQIGSLSEVSKIDHIKLTPHANFYGVLGLKQPMMAMNHSL